MTSVSVFRFPYGRFECHWSVVAVIIIVIIVISLSDPADGGSFASVVTDPLRLPPMISFFLFSSLREACHSSIAFHRGGATRETRGHRLGASDDSDSP